MKLIIKTLMKNDIRQSIKLFKNYGIIFVVFLLMILFSKKWIYMAVSITRTNSIYLNSFIGCALLVLFIFKKSPLIRIDPATIYYLMGTPFLKKILSVKLIVTLAIVTFIAFSVTFLYSAYFNIVYFVHLGLLLTVWSFLIWEKYNKNFQYLSLTGMCIATIIPFVLEWRYLGILLIAAVLIFFTAKPMRIDWETYYCDMKYYSKVQSAAARKDYADMVIIANENSVKKSYPVPYLNLKGIDPLLIRSIVIDGLRAPLSMWVIKIATLLVSLCSLMLTLDSIYMAGIFISAWSYHAIFIIKHSVEAALALQAKSEYGMFVPYTLGHLSICYTVFPMFEILFSLILLMLFTDILPWIIISAWLGYVLITYVWHLVALNHLKKRKWIDCITCMMISAISFLFMHG